MRQNINLYRDDDVIGELEKQLAGMSIAEDSSKSPLDKALDTGEATVGGDKRKVLKAKRSTEKGKEHQAAEAKARKKDSDLFKATLKKKAADDDDSDWTDVEEDFPHVQLTELLDGLTLDVPGSGMADDDEDVPEDVVCFDADGNPVDKKGVKWNLN
jgi:hypothetical protein